MKRKPSITTLFVDIGGVLLTDGWDIHARKRAAKTFKLDFDEVERLHHLAFDTYEADKLTLEDYLNLTVFNEPRSFTRAQFRQFMFAQSKPHPEMLSLIPRLKIQHGLKIFVVSNEVRELNDYRIHKFKLAGFVDAFISSCYVGVRKPDPDIFRLALEIAQTPVRQIVYLENTLMFVQIAGRFGIQSILHTDYQTTREQLAALGLPVKDV